MVVVLVLGYSESLLHLSSLVLETRWEITMPFNFGVPVTNRNKQYHHSTHRDWLVPFGVHHYHQYRESVSVATLRIKVSNIKHPQTRPHPIRITTHSFQHHLATTQVSPPPRLHHRRPRRMWIVCFDCPIFPMNRNSRNHRNPPRSRRRMSSTTRPPTKTTTHLSNNDWIQSQHHHHNDHRTPNHIAPRHRSNRPCRCLQLCIAIRVKTSRAKR